MQKQIPENWQKVKLGDVVEITSSKRIFAKEYFDEGVPFYRGKEIIEKFNGDEISTNLYISDEKYNEIRNRFGVPQSGDMLLTSVGTLGTPYLVGGSEKFYFKDGNLTWFRNYNGINGKFLYYWIQSSVGMGQLARHIIGSSQQALTIDGLKKVEVDLPQMRIQNQIVSILSAIDDEIKVNNKIAKTLQDLAQAIFKEWFTESSGKEYSFSSLANYVNGGVFGKIINKNKIGLPLIKIAELNRGITENTEWIEKPVAEKYYIENGDLLFSWSGSIGLCIWDKGKAILNQHLFNVVPNGDFTKGFLYLALESKLRYFKQIAGSKATTMGHIKKEHLEEQFIMIPQGLDLEIFNIVYKKLVQLRLENQKLAEIRDLLLPRLMKGEIRI